MIESRKSDQDVLDQDTLELLGSAPARADIPSQRLAQLRDRVMHRVDEEPTLASLFMTIRADEGRWIEIAPLMEKKVLNVNEETGIESYLLRLHPGAAPERHCHDEDELCIVLEGDVSFGDTCLEAGDYHFARKGSWHGRANTVHGALLFLQSAVPSNRARASSIAF